MIKKYLLYLGRWQLSTPILACVLVLLSTLPTILATVIANLVGGLMFFWIDKLIFSTICTTPHWEIKEDITCVDCGATHTTGYRIVEWLDYNKQTDPEPKYRCIVCKDVKKDKIRQMIRR